MKLANCKEHPDANRPDLTCWALRHDDGRKVTAQEAFDAIQERDKMRAWIEEAASATLRPLRHNAEITGLSG